LSETEGVRNPGRTAAVVFAGLVVATCAGLFLAQRLKHSPTSVHGFRLSPATFSPSRAAGPRATRGSLIAATSALEQLSFQTDTDHDVTVAIVNSSGETVATLVRGLPWERYLRLCLAWNGRTGSGHVTSLARAAPITAAVGSAVCSRSPIVALPAGRLAAAGDYRVRVSLGGGSHSILSPATFALVRQDGSP
jgi:hypothetical protein